MEPTKKHIRSLKKVFGFQTFRDKQFEIIDAILTGRDVCAIMFTSAGKSLCYQFPAVYTEKVVVVVSPLISLMNDQQIKMEEIGVPTVCLNGTVYNKKALITDILNNEYRLVYTTPEFIVKAESFLTSLVEEDLLICLAIDEAHCLSSWGHDFRESYRGLSKLRNWVPDIPIIAVTATATEEVQEDIVKTLKMDKPFMVRTTFDRPNIYIEIKLKNNLHKDLLPYFKRKVPTIIYCPTRKETNSVSDRLLKTGVKCDVYHAGMNSIDREMVHEKFINNEITCVVATVAFGMGIDKVIRRVIHYGIPKDIESYYQEIGRAGRDRKKSICTLFYSVGDLDTNNFFINQIKNTAYRRHRTKLLKIIKRYVHIKTCRRKYILNYFGEDTLDECGNCDNCKHPKPIIEQDLAKEACAMLKLVYDTGGIYGINMIIQVLRGSKSMKIPYEFKAMKLYGSGSKHSAEWWKIFSKMLMDIDYLKEKPIHGGRGFSICRTVKARNWISTVSNDGGLTLKRGYEKLVFVIPPELEKFYPIKSTNNLNLKLA